MDDERRNRFLPEGQAGNGGGVGGQQGIAGGGNHRAASQPPHPPATSSPFVGSLGAAGNPTTASNWQATSPSPSSPAHHLPPATRSSSFSGGRFGSTFEDDELLDPDDELYDAHYGSFAQYRGRPASNAIDLSRSRSQSLAGAIGAGRSLSSSTSSTSSPLHGYRPTYGLGSAANSYVTSNLYGNNAYAGHNNLAGGRFNSLGRRERERGENTNTSPFMRDVGALLDDVAAPGGSFRQLWERERLSGVGASYGGRGIRYAGEYEDDYGVDDDYEAYGYTESGATSRRHSVSGQPRARMTGFAAPDASGFQADNPPVIPSGGFARRGGGGGGGLLLTDDDLEGALGSLSLNTHTQTPPSPTRGRYFDSDASVLPRSVSQQRSREWAEYPASPTSPVRVRVPSTASSHGPLSPRGGGGGGYMPQYPQQPHYAPPAHQPHAPPSQPAHQQQHDNQGKGIPLHAVPPEWPLYIVEFKAGRTDLFYLPLPRGKDEPAPELHVGDLVIVEADRGKDLGKVINDSITIEEVEAYWAGRGNQPQPQGQGSPPTSPGGAGETGGGGKKEISPKMIYGKAGAGDAQLLLAKMQDELKALALCQTKVRAKKLPMEVVDAEYQWDRRKLTFYFVAEKRIDFRELVRELFRLYKTRIWMAALGGTGGAPQVEA
ncbi:PSP1 C-terminal domain-containing protein [Mycena indigotica]|uniref:PSP1 C-terminal domain-containing protein n=1 Tax=Mycena indigotica TaxID=2126181 RepID=A0A8H6VQP2_9AGAR|nr:PSP1 C-terminal domain-containing protein [Mycena indigotica]KAF7290174.1 PSP1 C-terminal domain-containing protein [Mycena indigotica]